MGLRSTIGAGRAATEALKKAIESAKGGDPMAPVTVAVPSGYAGLSLRRQLGSQPPGLVNVRFLVAGRIAELLGGPALAAAGRRPLNSAVQAEAIRAVLSADAGRFKAVAGHPSTTRSLQRAMAELSGCSPTSIEALAAASEHGAEIVRLFRAVRARWATHWYDEHDLARSAAAAVRGGSATGLDDVGQVIAFCLRPPAPAMADLFDAFGSRLTVIEGTVAGRRPRADLLMGCSDADEEVRAALRIVLERLGADPPVPLHRMAILYTAARPYAVIAHQQLDAAGLPHNGPAVRTLARSVTAGALLGLLALAGGGWRRDDVIDWLTSAPILDDGAGEAPATAWDAISRTAGVVAGAAQWHDRLGTHAAKLQDERSALAASEADPAWVDRIDAEIDRTERLRSFIHELVAVADPGGRTTWAELAGWAAGLLERYLGGPSRRERWPDEEQEAAAAVDAVLGRLAGLDGIASKPGVERFVRAVEDELDRPAKRVGTFGDGVFIGPLSAARAVSFDLVIVVGMAEGLMPGRGGDDALLPDADRAVAGGELARRARPDDDLDELLWALAAAPVSALTWPEGDPRRSRALLPSRWLLEAAEALAGREVAAGLLPGVALDPATPSVVAVPSFEAGARAAREPGSLLDYDLQTLLLWTAAGGNVLDHFLARESPRLEAGLTAIMSRDSTDLTRFDGYVGGDLIKGLGDVLSPTALESYAECPMKYFLGRQLGLGSLEKPEEVVAISAADRGSLVHRILEVYVRTVLDGQPRSLDRLLAIAADQFAATEVAGLAGRPLLWRYDREVIVRELSYLHEVDTNHPVAAELAFGFDGQEPVTLTLPSGRTVAFRGMADRVDDDGQSLLVTDYKTGSTRGYEDMKSDPLGRGRRLQLPVYAMAARQRFGADRPVRSRYWFVSEKAGFESYAIDLDDDVQARFHDVLEVIAAGITSGAFPARPGDPAWPAGFTNCNRCDFDRLCQAERDRHWERKKSAPAVRRYVELAESDGNGG